MAKETKSASVTAPKRGPGRPPSAAKFKYAGEDHLQGNVRLVFIRKSDDRVFTVEEAQFQDSGGHGIPPEIQDRLKR